MAEIRRKVSPINYYKAGKRAFTLIELLVIIAIIGILASIIIISYNNAQMKSRDNRRRADILAVASAHQMLYVDTKSWHIPNTGYQGYGVGVLNEDSSTDGNHNYCGSTPQDSCQGTSIGRGLEIGGYISSSPKDPKETSTNIEASGYFYMVYSCFRGIGVFARLESPTQAEQDEVARIIPDTNGNPGAGGAACNPFGGTPGNPSNSTMNTVTIIQ